MTRRNELAVAFALAVVCAAFAAPVAAQTLTPTAQQRRVKATLDTYLFNQPLHLEDTRSAPDFGPFSKVMDYSSAAFAPFFVGSPGDAAQDSTITPTALHARGHSSAHAGSGSLTPITRTTDSSYVVSFDVAESTPFVLSGLLESSFEGCEAGNSGLVRLTGPEGLIVLGYAYCNEYAPGGCQSCIGTDYYDPGGWSCSWPPAPLSTSGLLAPGSYTLEASAGAAANEVFHPGDVCPYADVSMRYDVDLLLGAQQVPALTPGPALALAAALALLGAIGVARARARR